jgi:hypothetical protein
MPWRNGKGTTTEVMISPAGAMLDAFDWRISMADVTEDGPFSAFPGIDRTLAVLDGAGLMLEVDGGPGKKVSRTTRPLEFPGDARTKARLLGGPVVDLNVMTRRAGGWWHYMARDRARDSYPLGPPGTPGDLTVVVLTRGEARAVCGTTRTQVAARDTIVIHHATPGMVEIRPRGLAELHVIAIGRRRTSDTDAGRSATPRPGKES